MNAAKNVLYFTLFSGPTINVFACVGLFFLVNTIITTVPIFSLS